MYIWQIHLTAEERQILCVMSELYDSYKNIYFDNFGIAVVEKQLMVRFGTVSELDQLPLLLIDI